MDKLKFSNSQKKKNRPRPSQKQVTVTKTMAKFTHRKNTLAVGRVAEAEVGGTVGFSAAFDEV